MKINKKRMPRLNPVVCRSDASAIRKFITKRQSVRVSEMSDTNTIVKHLVSLCWINSHLQIIRQTVLFESFGNPIQNQVRMLTTCKPCYNTKLRRYSQHDLFKIYRSNRYNHSLQCFWLVMIWRTMKMCIICQSRKYWK